MLKSLKIKKSKKTDTPQLAEDSQGDVYPWGTRIDLNAESLENLGIKVMPSVGSELMIECKVKVIAVRESASESDTSRSIELQITDMDLEFDDDEVSEGELTKGGSEAMKKLANRIKGM